MVPCRSAPPSAPVVRRSDDTCIAPRRRIGRKSIFRRLCWSCECLCSETSRVVFVSERRQPKSIPALRDKATSVSFLRMYVADPKPDVARHNLNTQSNYLYSYMPMLQGVSHRHQPCAARQRSVLGSTAFLRNAHKRATARPQSPR